MKLNTLLLAMLLVPQVQAEPFISEYVEGSGSNKALEIYNPADTAINLADYKVVVYTNGAAPGATKNIKTIDLSGSLAAKSTYVLTDASSVAALAAKSNMTIGTNNFNGNDAIALYKGSVLIDAFGQIGNDPGSYWGVKDKSTQNQTLVRKASIGQGDANGSDAFDPAAEWDFYAIDDFSHLGSHNSSGTGGGGGGEVPPVDPLIGNCGDSVTLISQIQGSTDISAENGKSHVIEAVVTLVSPQPQQAGFYIQEEAADQDNNPQTSEGLFVLNGSATDYPVVGQKVRVAGKVEEIYGKTSLRRSGMKDCGTADLPASAALTLPVPQLSQYEALENMRIHLPQALQVSDHTNLINFGELSLSSGRIFIPTNQFRPGTPEALALAEQHKRNRLILDDLQDKNPQRIPFPAPELSANNPVRLGDQVVNLNGVLDYNYSAWRVMPAGTVQFQQTNPRQDQPEVAVKGQLRVASANVLNYFNGINGTADFTGSRGAKNSADFEKQAAKIVAALVAVNADVLGLMEIENDGYDDTSAIVDLVGRLNQQLGADTYRFIQVPGSTKLGTDAIAVGMLYKPAKVSPVGQAATTNTGVFGFGNRQPLAQSFRDLSNRELFTVVVNHFKSKSCGSPTGADADLKDGQSCWNATRVKAATELSNWLATAPTGVADKDLLIIGDLNAYAKEDPIYTLEQRGYQNLIEKFHQDQGYSYQYDGEIGYLDHALASASLAGQTVYAMEYHINADESVVYDYTTTGKSAAQQAEFYQTNQFRAADHDPVVIELTLRNVNPADLDKDGDIDNADITAFANLLKTGPKPGLEYDFNKDGVVNAVDTRAMALQCTYARCAIK